MCKRILLICFLGLGILWFTGNVVQAETYKAMFYEEKGHDVSPVEVEMLVEEESDECETYKALFEKLLAMNYNEKQIQLIPEKTTIKQARFEQAHLQVVFSDDITTYGGNSYEYYMINQLLYMAFAIETVDEVSLSIHGRDYFVEGSVIEHYSRDTYLERMKKDGKSG